MPKKTTKKKAAPARKTTAPRKTAKKAPKKAAARPAKAESGRTKSGEIKASFKKEMIEKLTAAKNRILQEVADKVRCESNSHKFEIGDIYDIASSERERELALTLGDRDRGKLSEIEEAIERLEDGTYGECEECGEPIAENRLRALLFTRVCVECQSRNERELRIKGRLDEESGLGILDKSENEEDEF